ncbi:Fimbrin [Aphelenchoides bicaudatus]|nr:Fimbrin [Aphelenchoides bicaudatus]
MIYIACRQFRTSAILGRARFFHYNKHKKVTDPARQEHEYFEKQAAALPLDEHYIDNLKMLWEEKIGSERELHLKAEDHLIGRAQGDYGLPALERLRPKLEYEKVVELKDAPEDVRKIFSIEFGERSDYTDACKSDLIELVRKHRYDKGSTQIQIAWSTVIIRHLTALVDEFTALHGRRPRIYSDKIHRMVGYRGRMLKLLREQDIEAFEKILKDLKISYQIPKHPEHVKTRKAWSLFLLRQRVDAEKEAMMEALRMEFEKDKDSKLKALNNKIDEIVKQREEIQSQLKELELLENRKPVHTDGEYQPKLIEEVSETEAHYMLFGHAAPSKKAV